MEPTNKDTQNAGPPAIEKTTSGASAISKKRLSDHVGARQSKDSGQTVSTRHTISGGVVLPRVTFKKEKMNGTKIARILVDNKFFVFVTTLLTIYALIGDDCRLLWTNRPADKYFDILTLTCLVVFTLEIMVSIIGKDDYFMGFFFILDVVSTATLVLDLSAVQEQMAGGGEDDDTKSLRSGRTARLGARASRIVRVIRLVRILKLYKAFHDAKQREKRRKEVGDRGTDDEDDWDDEEMEAAEARNEKHGKTDESRVGKKLSDMTTRRVICLVLTMLLVFPVLKAQGDSQLASSGWYGADNVWKNFQIFLKENPNMDYRITNSSASMEQQIRSKESFQDYEHALLTYVYFHNWYADRGFCEAGRLQCADRYFSHLFWIGIMGPKGKEDLIKTYASAAEITHTSVTQFLADKKQKEEHVSYAYGDSPVEATKWLSAPWTQRCETKTKLRLGLSLIQDQIDGVVGFAVKCPDDLRITETAKFYTRLMTPDQWRNKWYMVFYFDLRPFIRTDAGFNLLVTGFIVIVLCSAALMFTNDANKLVLRPVENMIKRVEAIRRDPLVAMQMADEEFKHELMMQAKAKRGARLAGKSCIDLSSITKYFARSEAKEPMETVILEKTIIKLGSLLALGFGEAGAGIVTHNIRSSDSAGVNALVPGSTVKCILGLARIKNFSTANEVFKERIMTFANQIAEIVHGVVNEYHGAANKNNGDSFLLIWRMNEESILGASQYRRMGELALVSFARVIGALHHSPLLAEYRTHPGLQQRLGTATRVNMSFGLHFGWAIEGAVGSEFKIDASYLSPNVSIVNGIEKATNTYGVPFLIAESVFELLGSKMQERLRQVDRVILTGSTHPMRVFSVDLDVMAVKVGPPPMKIPWNPRRRFEARQFLESEKAAKLKEDLDIVTLFDLDSNIVAMRKRYNQEFMESFNMGYQNYSQGEWAVARRILISTQTMLGFEDGPSTALLRFMEQHRFQAPKQWNPPGARDLDRAAGVTSI